MSSQDWGDILQAGIGAVGLSTGILLAVTLLWIYLAPKYPRWKCPPSAILWSSALRFMIGSAVSTLIDYVRIVFDVSNPGTQFNLDFQVGVVIFAGAFKLWGLATLSSALVHAFNESDTGAVGKAPSQEPH